MPRKMSKPSADEVAAKAAVLAKHVAALKEKSERMHAVVESAHERADALHRRIHALKVETRKKRGSRRAGRALSRGPRI